MSIRKMAVAAATISLLAACAKKDEPAPAAATTQSTEAHDEQAASTTPALPRKAAPAGASVVIVSPKDGETVTAPVKVVFGISGMTLAPAGEDTANTGHHHLLIDTDLADPTIPIPADAKHMHFGKAQTEASVDLPPGQHTLQLVLGDYLHIPFDPVVASPKITITVN
jgi:hypothetical protein